MLQFIRDHLPSVDASTGITSKATDLFPTVEGTKNFLSNALNSGKELALTGYKEAKNASYRTSKFIEQASPKQIILLGTGAAISSLAITVLLMSHFSHSTSLTKNLQPSQTINSPSPSLQPPPPPLPTESLTLNPASSSSITAPNPSSSSNSSEQESTASSTALLTKDPTSPSTPESNTLTPSSSSSSSSQRSTASPFNPQTLMPFAEQQCFSTAAESSFSSKSSTQQLSNPPSSASSTMSTATNSITENQVDPNLLVCDSLSSDYKYEYTVQGLFSSSSYNTNWSLNNGTKSAQERVRESCLEVLNYSQPHTFNITSVNDGTDFEPALYTIPLAQLLDKAKEGKLDNERFCNAAQYLFKSKVNVGTQNSKSGSKFADLISKQKDGETFVSDITIFCNK